MLKTIEEQRLSLVMRAGSKKKKLLDFVVFFYYICQTYLIIFVLFKEKHLNFFYFTLCIHRLEILLVVTIILYHDISR